MVLYLCHGQNRHPLRIQVVLMLDRRFDGWIKDLISIIHQRHFTVFVAADVVELERQHRLRCFGRKPDLAGLPCTCRDAKSVAFPTTCCIAV